ncbi:hypothetical protein EG329_007073 [Mollisiaceae sp. DMI_Dod_QoI]|nr:hypothetical protein EG329_007073 [Helotiales sp. DMI_Dod_QoI]
MRDAEQGKEELTKESARLLQRQANHAGAGVEWSCTYKEAEANVAGEVVFKVQVPRHAEDWEMGRRETATEKMLRETWNFARDTFTFFTLSFAPALRKLCVDDQAARQVVDASPSVRDCRLLANRRRSSAPAK